jgi:hypothetical protein
MDQRPVPRRLGGGVQDFPAWRQGGYEVLDLILRSAGGTVIVPMTLIEPAYFADIIGRLSDAGHDVRHIALLADRQIIERRRRQRAIVHAVQRLRGQDAPLFREARHRGSAVGAARNRGSDMRPPLGGDLSRPLSPFRRKQSGLG